MTPAKKARHITKSHPYLHKGPNGRKCPDVLFSNSTAVDTENHPDKFWLFFFFTILSSVVATIGNGLVILTAIRHRRDGSLNGIIKSLALTDLLYALLGPLANYMNFYLIRYSGDTTIIIFNFYFKI